MDRLRKLRAYEQPPYRAEEWLFFSQYQERTGVGTPSAILRIRPNNQPDVPEGYRGVLSVLRVESMMFRAPYRFQDLSEGNRYNLRVNGVVVPGYHRRPVASRLSYVPFLGTDATQHEWNAEAWTTGGVIEPLVIAPPRLQSGDVLEIEFVAAQADVMTAILVQGYWWPVSDEDNSGAGNLADPL